MRTGRLLIIVTLLVTSCAITPASQTRIGPGPDPACGGTELSVTEQKGRVVAVEQTIYASNHTLVERYTPLDNGDWQACLSLYSSSWKDEVAVNPKQLMRTLTFKTAEAVQNEAVIRKFFDYGQIDWQKEPTRLLDYYHAHQADFKEQ